MYSQLGYPYPQQPAVPSPTPIPQPPSFEGTALAATIGAGAGALATEGFFHLLNARPASMKVEAAIAAGVAVFGGATSAFAYRSNARRAYEAAQSSMRIAGPDLNSRVMSFRAQSKGRLGNVTVEAPVKGIIDIIHACQGVANSNTPELVNKYYDVVAEHAVKMAGQTFTEQMPPPQSVGMQNPASPPSPQYYAAPWCPPQHPQQQYAYPFPPQYVSPPQQPQAAPPKNGR